MGEDGGCDGLEAQKDSSGSAPPATPSRDLVREPPGGLTGARYAPESHRLARIKLPVHSTPLLPGIRHVSALRER